jgi:hypothetical protein
MASREQLHTLIEQLPESELSAAARYLEFLKVRDAPVEAEMLARIDEARAHPSRGIDHEEVLKEFGL